MAYRKVNDSNDRSAGVPFYWQLLEEAHCLSDSIVSLCRSRSLSGPRLSVKRTSQLVTIQELVAARHGISFIPAMAKELDHSPRRIYRSVGSPKPTRTVIMAWNPIATKANCIKVSSISR
ncbi:MAG: LysR substrate-binding domain-containing protein [Pirellulales bacterium]